MKQNKKRLNISQCLSFRRDIGLSDLPTVYDMFLAHLDAGKQGHMHMEIFTTKQHL